MSIPKHIFERFPRKKEEKVEVDMEVIKEILKDELKRKEDI